MNAIADEGKPVIDVKRWINMGVDPERPQGVICLNPERKRYNRNLYILGVPRPLYTTLDDNRDIKNILLLW